MAKVKNAHYYATPERIREMKSEYDFIGRWVTKIDPGNPGHLIVYAVPPKKRDRKKEEKEVTARQRRGNGYNRYKEMD